MQITTKNVTVLVEYIYYTDFTNETMHLKEKLI